MAIESPPRRAVKCVVWDLDNTVWRGILAEDAAVELRAGVADAIRTLDGRGILHSVASRNDAAQALAKLEGFGLREFFLHPQINWNSKASSLAAIAGALGLALDSFAFIDDDPFERAEINFSHPEVLCLDAADVGRLTELPALSPATVTADARMRRRLYLDGIARERAEAEFVGPREEFLATLGMVFSIAPVGAGDLERAQELTVRTHQLNTTGETYSREELDALRRSDDHLLLIASLRDRFGSYGRVGLAVVERGGRVWTLKLLLMSCRVASRGVGAVLLDHIVEQARQSNVTLRAVFVPNGRNRMMYVTYKFAGFRECGREGGRLILEFDPTTRRQPPGHVEVRYFPDSPLPDSEREGAS